MRNLYVCAALAVVLGASGTVLADWNPGDPHKMHYPQLPDPQGTDISMRFPEVLADDWQCTSTGPVSDVHFWFSVLNNAPPAIGRVHVSIHENIPAGPTGGFSRPGALLWSRDFFPTQFTWRVYGTGDQGWYVPENGFYNPHDHTIFYQLNIAEIVEPFEQTAGEIYWLDLSVESETAIGWKTSISPQFMDTATWGILPAPAWQPVYDPRFTGAAVPVDLAFVITPEPSTLGLLAVSALLAFRRR